MDQAKATDSVLTATPLPIESDERSHSVRNGLLCTFAVAACLLIVYPVANMPFLDDFSYAKTALDFARTGHFHYNGWATAMLGWMVPWGALFIKIFGFSFNILRLSMLPIALGTVYLFHQILRRFGVNPANAVLGTLALGLSPLFLPLAASFMTDVPGLLVILVCIYMCQRAVAARSDRAAILWLSSAMAVNVAGGTVRQIAWLGALVMVPATAWLLRERRGMKIVGPVLFMLSLFGVLACLHWFNRQPYSVPQHIFAGPIHAKMLAHLGAQLLKTFLCLLLVIFPVSVAWLPTARRLTRNAWLRFAVMMAVSISLAIILYTKGILGNWVMPWLTYTMAAQTSQIPGVFGATPIAVTLWMRLAISLLVVAPAILLAAQMMSRNWTSLDRTRKQSSGWNITIWILGPFSLSYLLLLVPMGTFNVIRDRYLLGLVPTVIVILLLLYQGKFSNKLSTLSVLVLIVYSTYSIGGTHDNFAQSRALVSTIQMVQSSGVSRYSIRAGMTSDGWAQIEHGGHINDPRIRIPAGAYNPEISGLKSSRGCPAWFTTYTPSIIPKYFIVSTPTSDCGPTTYPPVRYLAWLPPFHRAYYAGRIRPAK